MRIDHAWSALYARHKQSFPDPGPVSRHPDFEEVGGPAGPTKHINIKDKTDENSPYHRRYWSRRGLSS